MLTNGKYDDAKFQVFKKAIEVASTAEDYNILLKSIGLIPNDIFVDDTTMLRKHSKNLIALLSVGKDPFAVQQGKQDSTFVDAFAELLTTYENNSLNSTHINATKGKVYEYNRPNYLTRFITAVEYFTNNPSPEGDKFLAKFNNDPFYKNSLLLDKIKSGDVGFVILDSIQMPGKNQSTEYDSMDEKALALQAISSFNTGDAGYFMITNPVHSDAGIQTGLKIQGKPYKVTLNNKGVPIGGEAIDQLHKLAKRERYAVNNRLGIEKNNKHVMFPYLNSLSDAEINSQKAIDLIGQNVKAQYDEYVTYLEEVGVRDGEGFVDAIFPDNSFEGLTSQYFLNNLIYQTEAIWMLNGDPSFYASSFI